jgi:hypothetical protein
LGLSQLDLSRYVSEGHDLALDFVEKEFLLSDLNRLGRGANFEQFNVDNLVVLKQCGIRQQFE